jgi:aminotransferase
MKKKLSSEIMSMPPSGIREFFELVIGTPGVISLGVGEPDYSTPKVICDVGIKALNDGMTSYTSNWGLLELREEISRYIEKTNKIKYNPVNEVLVTVGVSEALDLTFRSIINRGDEVIIPEPSFVSYFPAANMAGAKCVSLKTTFEDKFRPNPEDIKKLINNNTKAILLNFPGNPTGATMTREIADEIVKIVLEHDLFLISDEVYLPLTYDTEPVSFADYPELKKNLIYLHGFSKAWAMTGWRLGFICAPSDVLGNAVKIHQYTTMCVSIISQLAGIEALKRTDEVVPPMRDDYKERRDLIYNGLTKIGIDTFKPEGAFYIFPSIKDFAVSSNEFSKRFLEKKQVAVIPGTAFGESGEGNIRMCYAASKDVIRVALKKLEEYIKEEF